MRQIKLFIIANVFEVAIQIEELATEPGLPGRLQYDLDKFSVIRRSVLQVCDAHFRGFARGQHRRNVAAVANRWQHCVQFDRPGNRTPNLRTNSDVVTTTPTGRSAVTSHDYEVNKLNKQF